MSGLIRQLIGLSLIVLVNSLSAQEFVSENSRVSLVELYTSEGCSSCPPAERWFNQLQKNHLLWKSFVPVVFHVDYWDYLGWKDELAKAEYSERQYKYRQTGLIRSVYTPGVLLNGKAWRQWRRTNNPPKSNHGNAGKLWVKANESELKIEYVPVQNEARILNANVAILSSGIINEIKSGENRGRTLEHHFVVRNFETHKAHLQNSVFQWNISNVDFDKWQGEKSLAVWVSSVDDLTPIQATGGYLMRH